jgi:hypothetical protein
MGLLTNLVVAFILHLVPGNILLAIGLSCYAIALLLGALQPLGMTYWAMSFPAMRMSFASSDIVIGVVGADITYVVASLFAATNVPESQQSIASGVVATTAMVWGSIYAPVSAALISGIPFTKFLTKVLEETRSRIRIRINKSSSKDSKHNFILDLRVRLLAHVSH